MSVSLMATRKNFMAEYIFCLHGFLSGYARHISVYHYNAPTTASAMKIIIARF